ncbi:hypothetical protein LTR70_007772 [Exophiala xenobiotica]|uniref:Uncharacterized protein n=1 Tax=Lithohypha guttulata TaxID=1690604 RepID=A0ABR0K2T8_9EURO|nr:hypothetical protein LTR24_007447 [Lithohypha guttulata]KAK5313154.1 hypothetical protein LTR70_007772 [Exophiala xenobiotica]
METPQRTQASSQEGVGRECAVHDFQSISTVQDNKSLWLVSESGNGIVKPLPDTAFCAEPACHLRLDAVRSDEVQSEPRGCVLNPVIEKFWRQRPRLRELARDWTHDSVLTPSTYTQHLHHPNIQAVNTDEARNGGCVVTIPQPILSVLMAPLARFAIPLFRDEKEGWSAKPTRTLLFRADTQPLDIWETCKLADHRKTEFSSLHQGTYVPVLDLLP